LEEGNYVNIHTNSYQRFSAKSAIPFFIIGALYTAWVHFALGGIRPDHHLFIWGLLVLFFFNKTSRNMVLAFGFILLYWLIFDSIRLIPNYEINPPLHIAEPYLLEKAWFGISTPEGVLTPNEYLDKNFTYTFLDIYTAIIYLLWIPVPLMFSFYLFFSKQREKMVNYLFGFLMVSQVGLIIQFIYPAAPPWYVDKYGFEELLNTPGNPGRLIEFDKYFGTHLFEGMYSLNANVFAAIPSLHCAFPIILIFFSWKYKFRKWLTLGIILMFSTWFSAVYTYHHYIIDVICGVGTALITIGIYQLLMKTKVKTWLEKYGKAVS
jgi:hypothetical protein